MTYLFVIADWKKISNSTNAETQQFVMLGVSISKAYFGFHCSAISLIFLKSGVGNRA